MLALKHSYAAKGRANQRFLFTRRRGGAKVKSQNSSRLRVNKLSEQTEQGKFSEQSVCSVKQMSVYPGRFCSGDIGSDVVDE